MNYSRIAKLLSMLVSLLFAFSIFAQPSSTREKHALIIALGDYAPGTGWVSISSMNDVDLIKKALEGQSFPEQNIKVITNKDATRSGIANAIKNLTNEVKQGDVAVIHVSSHGSQIEDDNNDETDGLDEAIVPYDAPSSRASTNFAEDQKKYFRDDEFGALINQLRQKLGREGDILVLMDNCHSGTGTRGSDKARGSLEPFVSDKFKAGHHDSKPDGGVFVEGSASRGDESGMASYVVISAARAAELNYETHDDNDKPVGSLSYAFSKVSQNLDAGTTYRTLFSRIQVIMNEKVPSQKPVMEGSGVDRSLFGGDYQAQKPYVELGKIISDSVFRVQGGKFAGLDKGAKVEFYPSGTTDPSKAVKVAEGKVTKADMYSSDVTLTAPLKDAVASKYWGFITETAFNIEPISFNVLTPKTNVLSAPSGQTYTDAESDRIKAKLSANPMVKISADPELVLRKGKETDDLVIASNGYVYQSFKNTVDYSVALTEALRSYAQRKIILQDVNSPQYKLDVRLVPVVNEKADTALVSGKMKNGVMEFREGDTVMVWVKNRSNFNVYINILDVQPNGVINAIFPNNQMGITPDELKVPSQSEVLFPYPIVMTPPYGTEIFKVFASQDQINMEMIANSRGESTRGNLNSFERLVKDSYTSRAAPVAQKADGMAMSVPFLIVK